MTDTKGDGQLPEHVAENRRYWDGMADQWVARLGASLSPAPDLTYRPLSARLTKRGLVFPMRVRLPHIRRQRWKTSQQRRSDRSWARLGRRHRARANARRDRSRSARALGDILQWRARHLRCGTGWEYCGDNFPGAIFRGVERHRETVTDSVVEDRGIRRVGHPQDCAYREPLLHPCRGSAGKYRGAQHSRM